MHNFILRTIPDKFLSDTDEKILVAAFFSLSLEHHGAILHLIREGQFDGSAFALVRPLIDAAYRAHWIYACAKPEIVLRIKKGEDVYPGLPNMASEIEKRSDAGGIFATIGPYLRALHGYTHGGLEQLGRCPGELFGRREVRGHQSNHRALDRIGSRLVSACLNRCP